MDDEATSVVCCKMLIWLTIIAPAVHGTGKATVLVVGKPTPVTSGVIALVTSNFIEFLDLRLFKLLLKRHLFRSAFNG